uniref:HAD-IA family hydrolase n=1 Tax=Ningiella ruwaisensis TaxID=2364274 RepID=UPI00109F7676|nr:HAD-IA family hydrolase [Ningiella ruwaisensis]
MIIYKPFGEIKALTFDLDDTLYDNWPYILEAEQHLRTHIAQHYPHAKHYSPKDWLGFKQAALAESPELKHDMGALRTITLTKAFLAAGLGSDIIPDAVADCFDTFYHKRSDFTVDKNICKTLKKLSKRVPLVAITNGNVNLKQIGIEQYFTHALHASKTRRMKPYPDMFKEAISLLDLPAKYIMHVGDNLQKDVWGATQAGMISAWFTFDRKRELSSEVTQVLPHIELHALSQLMTILKQQK